MRRMLIPLAAVIVMWTAPVSRADDVPWFAGSVGDATQVISVVGVGGSSATMDVWQNTDAGWRPVEARIPAHVGASGLAPTHREGDPTTPMGVFTLDFAFGTAP